MAITRVLGATAVAATLPTTVGGTGATTFSPGKVLQVVSTTKVDTFSVAGTGLAIVTGLSVAITPSATSSKILIQANFSGFQGDYGGGYNIYRDSTFISQPTGYSSRTPTHTTAYKAQDNATNLYSASVLDSPSSTSSLTYAIYVNALSNTYYHVNRSKDDTDTADRPRTISTITVMEIGA